MQCPHCGKGLIIIKAREGSGGGSSSRSHSDQPELATGENPTDAEMEEFIRAIDETDGIKLTDFEVDFIKSKFEAAEKYKTMRFFKGQIDVMKKMMAKYGDQVRHKGASKNANDKPSEPAKQEPSAAPSGQAAPPDDIPFRSRFTKLTRSHFHNRPITRFKI